MRKCLVYTRSTGHVTVRFRRRVDRLDVSEMGTESILLLRPDAYHQGGR